MKMPMSAFHEMLDALAHGLLEAMKDDKLRMNYDGDYPIEYFEDIVRDIGCAMCDYMGVSTITAPDESEVK